MSRRAVCVVFTLFAVALSANQADAQITAPRVLSGSQQQVATLQEQLNNQLRATTEQQRAYVAYLVQQVRKGRLDLRLLIAVKKKAVLKNRYYPFPFFERAIRFEAAKRNVTLLTSKQLAAQQQI